MDDPDAVRAGLIEITADLDAFLAGALDGFTAPHAPQARAQRPCAIR
jgi:hypothetical protein